MIAGKFVNLKSIFFTILIFVILSTLISFFKKLCGEQFSLVIQKESKNYIVKKIEEIEYAYINEHTGTLITKLISDIEKILDEVVFLKKGRVMLQDTADSVRAKYSGSIDQAFREVFRCF